MRWPSEKLWGLVDAVLALYTGDRRDVAEVVARHYSEFAVFDDPLVYVAGRRLLEAQFVALKGMFSSAECRDVKVSVAKPTTDSRGGGDNVVSIEVTVVYHVTRFSSILSLPLHQTTHLELDAHGLIEVHRDEWHNLPEVPRPLRAPLRKAYGTWRRSFGTASSLATLGIAALLDRGRGVAAGAADRLDLRLADLAGVDWSCSQLAGSLVDLRGVGGALRVEPSSFRDVTAVVLGSLDGLLTAVAAALVQGGAASLHVAAADNMQLAEATGSLRKLAGRPSRSLCAVTPHAVDFSQEEDATLWCWSLRQLLLGQGKSVDLLVLGALPGARAEVLDALLMGLQPALASRGRVVIAASASWHWRRPPSETVGEKVLSEVAAKHFTEAEAAAAQDAYRVALVARRGREWMALPTGVDCISCTPGACWSAWADVCDTAMQLRPVQLAVGLVSLLPGSNRLAAACKRAVTSRAASTVIHLCSPATYVSPGSYYWGQHRALGSASAASCATRCSATVVAAGPPVATADVPSETRGSLRSRPVEVRRHGVANDVAG